MNKIIIIALSTFKELIRNRIFYLFLFFAFLLVFLGVAVGQLSHTEQFRLTISLGLAAIHMCIMVITILLGSTVISKEIERLTILTLLSRPVSRTQFLLGKYGGLVVLLFVFNVGFFAVFCLNLLFMDFSVTVHDLWPVFYGIFLESLVLLAITIFFSTFCAPYLTVLFSICLFLVGHWDLSSIYVVKEGTHGALHYLKIILPNMEIFNWRVNPLEPFVTGHVLLNSTLTSMAWVAFFLILGSTVFMKKDFA
ncbi:MAG: ABC transporter permease subunit [Bdellovibrionaceae bacterium]|nr:ABC transporter permease subunit [Pseudobdellovibrionaceae bacterium]